MALMPKHKYFCKRYKGKVFHRFNYAPCHEGMWESGGIAPLFLASALDEGV
jgi:hypothetical protein